MQVDRGGAEIFTLNTPRKTRGKVKINGKYFHMQEDTSSDITLIPVNFWHDLGKLKLKMSPLQLKQFDGTVIKTLGNFKGTFENKNRLVRETWLQSQVESYQRLKYCTWCRLAKHSALIRWGSRIKWSNHGNGVAPFLTPRCCSYWKGNLQVTLESEEQEIGLLKQNALKRELLS